MRPASPPPPIIGFARTTTGGGGGGGSISLQTLAEGYGQLQRRRRDSWGSWEGDGSGGEREEEGVVERGMFGVAFPPGRE